VTESPETLWLDAQLQCDLTGDELDTLGRIGERVLAAVDPDGRWPA